MQKPLHELESICKKVVEMDPNIRFTGVVSDKGKLLASHKKGRIKLHVNEKNHEMLFMGLALQERMRQDFDEQLGPVDYSVSHRAKCVVIGFPFEGNILLVSGEKDLDITKVSSKILKMLNA